CLSATLRPYQRRSPFRVPPSSLPSTTLFRSFRFSPKTRRKVSVFSVCLGISVILWLFFYLSNEYRYRVGAYIVFVNQPAEKAVAIRDRKSTRLNSSHVKISYAVFCLKKKK